jgi:hypothetical protein
MGLEVDEGAFLCHPCATYRPPPKLVPPRGIEPRFEE